MQRFLCWDKKNVAYEQGVALLQHKPEKKNIALVCNDPWDGTANNYASVIKVGDTYRMYYRVTAQEGGHLEQYGNPQWAMYCVAESTDGGITFQKKRIGRLEYNGSKENNIFFRNENGLQADTFTVFYDDNPACPEDEKFKGLARYTGTDKLEFYVSKDGYEFTFVKNLPVPGTFDSYNVVFFNKETKQYNLYYRGYHHRDGTSTKSLAETDLVNDIRDVRLAVSDDFRSWEFIDFIKLNAKREIQMYTNHISKYYREPGTYIGFPTRYRDRLAHRESYNHMPLAEIRNHIIDTKGRVASAITDCGIMTSSDGLSFDLRPSAFMTSGPECSTNWWYGDGYLAYGMVETLADDGENREISIYTDENSQTKRVNFRRYTVRLDGFFSWYGDGNGAEVVTKPFVLKNGKMFVNFATSALGQLDISILDKEGNAIPGYESYTLFGDSTNRPVTFEKDLNELVGREIRVRFAMEDCQLYSYTFE